MISRRIDSHDRQAPSPSSGGLVEAIIYRPSRNVMQAATAGSHRWLLTYVPRNGQQLDPLMGWTGSADTRQQVTLRFPTREAAEGYARREGLRFVVDAYCDTKPRLRSYADNFKANRIEPWSH